MLLYTILLIGLIGSFLMFIGDMILYYSKNDYTNENAVQSIIDIMKKVSTRRLYTGGICGPVAAFLCCIGYYHFVLITAKDYVYVGWALFLINALGIILGGTYHSHCAYLGLIARRENKETLDEVMNYLKAQSNILFAVMAVGTLGQAVLIASGLTAFPRRIALVSPLPIMCLTPVVNLLPKDFHMIIAGGWKSLVFVIYYAAAIVWMY